LEIRLWGFKFPHLSKPQAAVLALWSFGIVLARFCTLSAVANILSPLIGRRYDTVRRRLRDWYKPAADKAGEKRRKLDVTTCFAPLLAWILKNWQCHPHRPASPEPDRAGRMWLAIALATFWVVAVGGRHDHDERPRETMPELPATDTRRRGPESPPGDRRVSVFCQGIAVILALLIKGRLALPEKWYPEPWPGVETIIQE
jgi:hypothetical protein